MEEHGPAPEDLKAWWPENGSAPGPPANPWHAVSPAQQPDDPRDWPAVRSELGSIVRMSATVVDTLACQLRQDEQAARLFARHLAEIDSDLRRLAHRLAGGVAGGTEPGPALAALEGYGDAVHRLEAGMESVFKELQQMQATQATPGISAALAEQSATLRALHGTVTAVLADVVEIGTARVVQLGNGRSANVSKDSPSPTAG